MSKEKQIEEMAKAMCGNGMSNGNCAADDEPCELECVYGCCAERLYSKGYRKQEWISVEDRLPEDGVWVLGYSAKSGRGGLCNCLKSYVREFGNYDDTTHWLPLPKFPKKKGE